MLLLTAQSGFSRNGTARSDTVVLPKAGFRKEIGPHHTVGFVDTEFDTFNLASRDLSGEAFPEAPRWNVAAGAFYQHPSGVFLGVDFEYTDDFRARIAQAPTDTLDDFFLTNVQAGYRSSWFVLKLFIDNVADRRYFLFADNDVASTLGDERLIGVSLDVFYDSPA